MVSPKKKQQRSKKHKVVMVSGGFDPIHPGHTRLFKEAKKLGDKLVVVINNDHWIRAKKGHGFMNAKDRAEVISSFRDVDVVMISNHKKYSRGPKDMSVCRELLKLRPHIFANGGDRNERDAENPKSSLHYDIALCKKLGIEMVYNVGKGGKIRSSSELLKEYIKKNK
ncbi:MAG: adenylyltransferase/cytidyltransferase family protein [Patescibacteria group bacterium]